MVDVMKDIMGDIIDFLVTHKEPFFNLSFITCVVGLGVIEAVTDFFSKGGDDE